jgi:hypothetical protein
MPPGEPIYATRWQIRKEAGRWVLRERGEWRMLTSYWWLAAWAATRDPRLVPDDQRDLARLV